MKEIILVRHAKSSWSDSTLSDHERPLNKRGRRDAPIMAERLADSEAELDGLVSSTARRAHQTAQAFAEVLRFEPEDIALDPQLYHADEEDWLEVIVRQPDHYACLAFFGHNPGLTYFLNLYLEEPVDNVPTCGLARLQFEVESWSAVDQVQPLRISYSIPKAEGWQELE